MNITSSVAQPSFKATLKQNATLKIFENSMTETEHGKYKTILKTLEKVSPDDVLELHAKDDKNNPYAAPYTEYFIRNPKKKGSDIKIYDGYNCKKSVLSGKFIDTLKNITLPRTKESETILTKPAEKDPRSIGERLSDFFFGSKCDDEIDFDPMVV